MEFKDHFSTRAVLYSQYRPRYPDELFAWIRGLCSRHELVWDCATGSGQAAVGLAKVFERVIATDASEKQISMAEPHPSIEYRVATAYDSGLDDSSADAVTVAQAIHWFDYERFYDEARRVLRPDGLVAVWGYGDPILDDARLHRIVHDYNRGTIESYWKPERDIILSGLKTIPFPFREVNAPVFTMERSWTLAELAGYMRTWSATAAFIEANGSDPVVDVEVSLAQHWGGETQRISWPLYVRAGYAD
jgi:ubiquinone/menaquinone biosynthesis C-methylase UbiE